MNRKEFIKTTGQAGAALCLGLGLTTFLQSCKSIKRVQAPLLDSVIRIDQKFVDRKKQLLIENEALPAPIYLAKRKEIYIALLLLCTHKECEVNPAGEAFTCPCHGSQFTKDGGVLTGPAEKPLTQFETEVVEDQVYVYLNKIVSK